MISYAVRVSFSGSDAAGRGAQWLDWMRTRHLADVLEAGADDAVLIRLDVEAGPAFEVRYSFADRLALEDYLLKHAPRLRAEGLRLFPVESGVSYIRETGDVIEWRSSGGEPLD